MSAEFILFVFLGLVMGVISGMGLGGGKILIPALVLFTSVNQAEAQGATLLSFIPISIVAILTHMKEKNIQWSLVGWVVAGAVGGSLIGSFIAMGPLLPHLRIIFGLFLIGLGIFELFVKDKAKRKLHKMRTS